MRMLGIDYGSVRVGVALGDTITNLASPWTVISGTDRLELLRKLHDLIANEHIEAVVVGIPKPLHDREHENDQVKEVKLFIEDMKAQGVVVHEEDEAMSSQLAARQVQAAGEKGKRDDLAATVILQSWLDRHAVSS
ncbi:MAG: Holliday junction resolvase RuvX [Patescibacteria group bacterium]|jgi:putative Holliday junction resolvase